MLLLQWKTAISYQAEKVAVKVNIVGNEASLLDSRLELPKSEPEACCLGKKGNGQASAIRAFVPATN